MVGRRRRWKALLVSASVVTGVLLPMHPGAAAELLSDGFESGTLGQWTSSNNFSPQQAIRAAGAWAGRATGSSGSAHATKVLSVPQSDLYVRALVEVVSHAGSTPLLRVRTAGGKIVASLNVNASDKLVLKNVLTGGTRTSALGVSPGAFVDLQLHVLVNGASGVGEAWANGVRVDDISGAQDFGTAAVGQVVLGRNDTASTSMDVVFDDVIISTTFVGGGGGGTAPPIPTGLSATAISATRVDLSWNASSGATGYTVYRDGGLLATPTSTSFTDTTVAPSTPYAYAVAATNGSGSSDASAPVDVTTPPDTGGGGGAVVMAAGDIACDPSDGELQRRERYCDRVPPEMDRAAAERSRSDPRRRRYPIRLRGTRGLPAGVQPLVGAVQGDHPSHPLRRGLRHGRNRLRVVGSGRVLRVLGRPRWSAARRLLQLGPRGLALHRAELGVLGRSRRLR